MNKPTHEEIERVIQTEAYQACMVSPTERLAEILASTHFDLPFFTWLILDYLRKIKQPTLPDTEKTALEQTITGQLLAAPAALWHTPLIAQGSAPEYPLIPFALFLNHLLNAPTYNVNLAACLPPVTESLIHTYVDNLKNTFEDDTFRRIMCDFCYAFAANTDNATLNQIFHLLLPHFTNDLLMHDLFRFNNAGNTPFRLLSIGFSRSLLKDVFLEDYQTLFNQIPPEGLSIDVTQGVEPGDTALRVLTSLFLKILDNPRLDALVLSAVKKAEGRAFGKMATIRDAGLICPISDLAKSLAKKPQNGLRALCLYEAVGKLTLSTSKTLIDTPHQEQTSLAQFLLDLVFNLHDKPNPMMMIPVRQLIQLNEAEQNETGSTHFFQQILLGLSPEQTLTLMVFLLLEMKENKAPSLPKITLLCQLGRHLPLKHWETNVRLSTFAEEAALKKHKKLIETGSLFNLFLQGLRIDLKHNQAAPKNILIDFLNHLLEQCIKNKDEAMKEMWGSVPLIEEQLSPLHQLAKLAIEHPSVIKLLCKTMMIVPQSALRALAKLWTSPSMPPEVKQIYEKRCPASKPNSAPRKMESEGPKKSHAPTPKKSKSILPVLVVDTPPPPPSPELIATSSEVDNHLEPTDAPVEIDHTNTQGCQPLTELHSAGQEVLPAQNHAVDPFFSSLSHQVMMTSYDALNLVKSICPFNDPNSEKVLALMNSLNRIHPSFWVTQVQINNDKVSPFLYLINHCLYRGLEFKPTVLYYGLISQIARSLTEKEWLTGEFWNSNHWTYLTKIVDALYYNPELDLALIQSCKWFIKKNPQEMWTKGIRYNGVEVEFPLRQLLGVLWEHSAESTLYQLVFLAEYHAPKEAWHQCGIDVPHNTISAYSILQSLVQNQQVPSRFMKQTLAILDSHQFRPGAVEISHYRGRFLNAHTSALEQPIKTNPAILLAKTTQ